jgi:MoxR-like ATPase
MEKGQVESSIEEAKKEMHRVLIGQETLVEGLLTGLFARGHILVEGVPGLAKTLAAKTLAKIVRADFRRIQFTPDLLPADLTGTMVYRQEPGEFVMRFGPVFSNIVVADEINRSPAKVQAALLEAMEERQVTVGETTYPLEEPFFVIATQNPIEQEGTYPLPEAQMDRFLQKILIDYPRPDEEVEIVNRMGGREVPQVRPILSPEMIREAGRYIEQVRVDGALVQYIVDIVGASRPEQADGRSFSRFIDFGASPRGSIALFRCAKVEAVLAGRDYVLPEDIKRAALPALRHRIILSYEAEAEGITQDAVVEMVLGAVPIP